jgi:hypothetical protein
METKQAQAAVTLDESVMVTRDILGAEESTWMTVAGDDPSKRIPVGGLDPPRLCFPELSNNREWGRRTAAFAEVSSLLVTADLPAEGVDVMGGAAHVFATSCVPWVRQLADWISVLTGQLVGTRHRPGLAPVDAFYVKAALDTGEGIKPIKWITFSRPRPKKEEPARLEHIKHALDHLSRNELAPLPDTLLIDARTEQYRGAYERAIMDAYVAVETALAQATGDSAGKIYKYFNRRKWEEHRKADWPGLPEFKDVDCSLVRVRNAFAAHTRLQPATAAQCYDAIRVAIQVVHALVPRDPPCAALPTISSCPWRPPRCKHSTQQEAGSIAPAGP